MTDWMKKLKDDVEKEVSINQDEQIILNNKIAEDGSSTEELYKYLLDKISKEDIFTFTREVLSGEKAGSLQIRYPENTINLGEFWLELGVYRYAIKLFYNECKIECKMTVYNHPKPKRDSVKNGNYDFTVLINEKKIIVESQGVKNNELNASLIIQKLFSNLYRASIKNESFTGQRPINYPHF